MIEAINIRENVEAASSAEQVVRVELRFGQIIVWAEAREPNKASSIPTHFIEQSS